MLNYSDFIRFFDLSEVFCKRIAMKAFGKIQKFKCIDIIKKITNL